MEKSKIYHKVRTFVVWILGSSIVLHLHADFRVRHWISWYRSGLTILHTKVSNSDKIKQRRSFRPAFYWLWHSMKERESYFVCVLLFMKQDVIERVKNRYFMFLYNNMERNRIIYVFSKMYSIFIFPWCTWL